MKSGCTCWNCCIAGRLSVFFLGVNFTPDGQAVGHFNRQYLRGSWLSAENSSPAAFAAGLAWAGLGRQHPTFFQLVKYKPPRFSFSVLTNFHFNLAKSLELCRCGESQNELFVLLNHFTIVCTEINNSTAAKYKQSMGCKTGH